MATSGTSVGLIYNVADFVKKVTDPDALIGVTDFVGETASLALRIGTPALAIGQFAAGFIPGLAPAVQIMAIAAPYLQKIATAAPLVHQGIEQSKPIVKAIEDAGPDLVETIKKLFAATLNEDPRRPEFEATSATVSTEDALSFATKGFFERSFFLPQDPRFDRMTESMG